jgi:hypothetical protein
VLAGYIFIASEGPESRALKYKLTMAIKWDLVCAFVWFYSNGAQHEIDFRVLLSFGITPLLSPLNNTVYARQSANQPEYSTKSDKHVSELPGKFTSPLIISIALVAAFLCMYVCKLTVLSEFSSG